jgi:Mitochondrial carrier protein
VSVMSAPAELVKIQMQLPQNRTLFGHSWDCWMKLVNRNGSRVLYHGFKAQLIREAAGFGTYFTCYESFCRLMSPTGEKKDVSPWAQFLSGGLRLV